MWANEEGGGGVDNCLHPFKDLVEFLKSFNSLNLEFPSQSMVIVHAFLLETATTIQHAVAYSKFSVTLPLVFHPTLVSFL